MSVKYSLRRPDGADLPLILAWRNRDGIRKFMLNDHVISWEDHLAWFNSREERGDDIWLFCADGRPWGVTSFVDFDGTAKSVVWSFYIGAPDAAKGAGLMLGYCSLEYIFRKDNVASIKNQVISANTASMNFHKKLFFAETGRAEGKIKRFGALCDLVFFELAKTDWQKCKAAVKKAAREKLGKG
jgi:UDP-4-amino-4,6-dideoxy-N-acetyl-beta-L-altrosamine N-acetyltransferase